MFAECRGQHSRLEKTANTITLVAGTHPIYVCPNCKRYFICPREGINCDVALEVEYSHDIAPNAWMLTGRVDKYEWE
jgi:hypothetical protein